MRESEYNANLYLQGPTQPEYPDAHEQNEIVRRAEDLAGDSFDRCDKDAQDWVRDHYGTDVLDALIFAAMTGRDLILRKETLRDLYVAEQELSYRDLARDEIMDPMEE